MLGPLIVITCALLFLTGLVAAIASLARRGRSALLPSLGSVLGSGMVLGWIVLWSGVMEQRWGFATPAAWLAGFMGALGTVLIMIGIRAALVRQHKGAGLCAACGYEVGTFEICPECGRRIMLD